MLILNYYHKCSIKLISTPSLIDAKKDNISAKMSRKKSTYYVAGNIKSRHDHKLVEKGNNKTLRIQIQYITDVKDKL